MADLLDPETMIYYVEDSIFHERGKQAIVVENAYTVVQNKRGKKRNGSRTSF